MTVEYLAFFILSVFAIGGSVFMINLSKVMHMALALAFTFLSVAGLYFLLDAEFLAVVQILIYTGAITVLMIFGIMLTKHREESKNSKHPVRDRLAFLIVALFFGIILLTIYQVPIDQVTDSPIQGSNVEQLGELLFKNFVIPFELISILLLVALIGAILLAKKEEKE